MIDLVIPCVCSEWESARRAQDLDELKRRCGSVLRKLESLSGEIESLGEMPLKHMGGMPLSSSLSLPLVLGASLGINPPADFFITWLAGLRAYAVRLDKLRATLVEGWSIRQSSGALNNFVLYMYCREATNHKASYADVADLLSAGFEANDMAKMVGEDVLRMQVRRLRRRQTQPLCKEIKSLMKQYIASESSGKLNFIEWFLTRKLTPGTTDSNSKSFAEPNVYELLAKRSKQTERLLEFVGTEPDSPEALEAQIASLISTLRIL